MSTTSRKRWTVALGAVLLLIAMATWVLSLPAFGGSITGERLARVQGHVQYRDGAFVNPEPQAPSSIGELGTYLSESVFYDEVRVPPAPLPVLPVEPDALLLSETPSLRAFWIGHASVYVEIDGLRVLVDPVFSEYASPFEFGPARFHPPPIELDALPDIDAVVISHDHYDHLDMATIRHLAVRGTRFFVPLGVGAHLERWKVSREQITELAWWEEARRRSSVSRRRISVAKTD